MPEAMFSKIGECKGHFLPCLEMKISEFLINSKYHFFVKSDSIINFLAKVWQIRNSRWNLLKSDDAPNKPYKHLKSDFIIVATLNFFWTPDIVLCSAFVTAKPILLTYFPMIWGQLAPHPPETVLRIFGGACSRISELFGEDGNIHRGKSWKKTPTFYSKTILFYPFWYF